MKEKKHKFKEKKKKIKKKTKNPLIFFDSKIHISIILLSFFY